MIKPQRYFPWRLARQFYFGHLIFVLVTLVLTGFSLRYFVYKTFVSASDVHQALARFDSYLTSLFTTVLIGAGIYLAVSTRFYVHPLGRLIQKARELRRLDRYTEPGEISEDDLNEEPGEWCDLERAINRLHRDLRSRSVELSREREELSTLIGAVSDAILAVDRDGGPLFYNSQFAVLFRTPQTAGKARTLNETFRVPEVLDGFRDVLQKGQSRIVQARLHTFHHGFPRHFSISIAPLRSAENEPVYGAIGIFHDVTELKQSEQIRIEFVGNASHELRTPLTSIKGYLDTLRDDIKMGRMDMASQFLDIIGRNVDRLILLVNDLLDLSIIESGAELKKAIVSTRDVTEAVLRQLEDKRAAKKLEIATHYEAESLLADGQRVEQVLTNLIHNAIKYVPEGRRVDIYWQGESGQTILRVKDNGPGVPYEHQGRLFERFYRIDAGRSREHGGTGLGLSIVKHIMIKHGGTVRLLSLPGEGAEFICSFPD